VLIIVPSTIIFLEDEQYLGRAKWLDVAYRAIKSIEPGSFNVGPQELEPILNIGVSHICT